MFGGCSSLKISETQTGDYQYAYRIPTSGTGTTANYWSSSMFINTGGTFTGNPSINTTYYTDHAPVSASGQAAGHRLDVVYFKKLCRGD